MASLLDMMMQARRGAGRRGMLDAPSSGEMLRARAGGLLGPAPEPEPPSLLSGGSPGPTGGAAVQRPTGPGAPAGPGGPPPQGAGPQPGPSPALQDAGGRFMASGTDDRTRQFQGMIAGQLARVTPDGSVPPASLRWIREATKDAGRRTAGSPDGVGFLGKLFGLERVPGLTEAQSGRFKRNGLLTAGLALMGAPSGVSTWQALAQGILAARMDIASTAGEALDLQRAQQEMQRRSEIFANPDLSPIEKWEEFGRQAAVSGNITAAELAHDQQKMLRELGAGEAESEVRNVNGQLVQIQTDEDGAVTVRDAYSGDVLRQAPGPAVDDKERLDRVNQLADDFRTEASDAQDVANAVAIGLDAPANAAGDVTLLTMLTRTIDPGVSVREADIRRGETIGGLSERAKQMVNQVASGGEMSEEQRAFIRSEIERVGREQRRNFLPTFQRYAARSMDAGVDPRFVVFDPFAPIFGPANGGGTDPGGSVDDPFAGPPPGQGGN